MQTVNVIDNCSDVIMNTVASQITSISIAYSIVCSCADQRKHQGSASLAFFREIHRWPVNSPHKRLVTRKMFPLNDVIMLLQKSRNAPTHIITQNFVTETSTFLIQNGALWVICIMHCGICEMGPSDNYIISKMEYPTINHPIRGWYIPPFATQSSAMMRSFVS